MTNNEYNALMETIACAIDEALDYQAVQDGDVQAIFDLIDYYKKS